MSVDPLDVLRGPDRPVAPRREFAMSLRRTLEGALSRSTAPGGSAMPSRLYYFTLPAPDRDRSRSFWTGLFGWQLAEGPNGFHIEGVMPAGGLSFDSSAPQVWLTVDDIDAATARVRAAGGRAAEPVVYESGAAADCHDDQGTTFSVSVPIPEYESSIGKSSREGELFYFSLPAPDGARAKAFYGAVCGWEFDDEVGEQGGMHVANMDTDGGLGAGRPAGPPSLWFRVDDLDAAVARVRALGGRVAGDLMEGPEGRHAACTDDQGVEFGLSQPAPGY